MDLMVTLDGIGVSLDSRPVLRDVDLSVGSGRAAMITGPNGSGKTTLLRLIATLIHPTEGAGTVAGVDLGTREARALRTSIGLVTHTPALIADLTLRENLDHFSRLSRLTIDIDRLLAIVGLAAAADRRTSECSFGMLRRTEIAWLIASKPALLLLDEAHSGLDDAARQLIGALVEATLDRGGSLVAVSHAAYDFGQAIPARYELTNGRLEQVT